ncbi:MAG: autotransporter-associated beta strand repeat-containing protein [Akkermansia sp.]|nr:autotransporter-associated beta strand repeat-containing protein [Akkermansia sp.]
MKLHLPLSLRLSLLAIFAVTVPAQTVQAGIMNDDISLITYTDFGQNKGRFVTDSEANALLKHLRQNAGGVVISYAGGEIVLPHEMPDFSSSSGNGSYTVTGYNALLSVQHMPVYNGGLTGNDIGGSNQIVYQAIEYGTNPDTTFLHSPDGGRSDGGVTKDHKISRLSKIVTDVDGVTLFSGTGQEMADSLSGQLVYRAGAGKMYIRSSEDGSISSLAGSHSYIIGGVDTLDATGSTDKTVVLHTWMNNPASADAINNASPLPYASHQGDSGSPLYVYHNGRYEYIGSASEANGTDYSRFVGAVEYDNAVLNQYNKVVEADASVTELHIGAVTHAGTAVSGNVHTNCYEPGYDASVLTNVTATPYYGKITTGADGAGEELQSFVGVRSEINTWNSLAGVIDNRNWYNYGTGYLNAAYYPSSSDKLSFADLFLTENLVFKSAAAATSVVLDATVDLGIGYAHFSGEGACKEYTVKSGGTGSHQFNHAGYVIDKDVSVHLQLTGDADHVYEWRKVGEGDLHIEGSGDNKILLNVGGRGSTYLSRTDGGYAAYNVLANTGATVVIADIKQIKRDFTFGNNGGVLNMNGNSMEWNNSNGAEEDGFTIHALDEQAVIYNDNIDSATKLTWTQGGTQTFLGSFADNGANSVLQFVYDGKEGSQLTLHSIKTSLTAPGSGMVVNSGTLMLSGTNTVHGKGSATGTNPDRYAHALDWHYADATSNVTVNNGGTFALGSHARLTGDVTVLSGGRFVMHEGVNHAEEFIEGGQRAESTAAIADFYGLKGDVSLADGAVMEVTFSADTTAKNSYDKNISGAGDVTIDAASAILQLGGDNSFSGAKTVVRGGLVGDSVTALGDTSDNKWVVQKDGWIASHKESAEDLLARIDTSSTGTLALSADTTSQLTLAGHSGLYLGAESGVTVNYGESGTSEKLQAVEGAWRLGGGGGTLVVNYLLADDNDLLLGASESSTGVVHLANTNNSFTGSISFAGENVILTYEEGALGNAVVDLAYGNSMVMKWARELDLISKTAEGVALVDKITSADLDLSKHTALSLGSSESLTYTGEIKLAENQVYRFSSVNGATFTVGSALQAGHDVVVDAQGSTGGRVVLLNPSDMDGSLSVQGYRDSSSAGQITLELAQDIALSDTLTVGSGATVQGKNIEMSSESGFIELHGNLEYDSLTVKNGATLNMRSGGRLDADTAATIDAGGIMRLNTQTLQDKVELKNGGTMYGNGGTIGASATVKVTEGTGTLSAGTGTLEVYGSIGATSGSTMILDGPQVNLRASEINTDGGILDVRASIVSMANINRIGGTLAIGANVTVNTDLAAGRLVTHRIDAIDIGDDKTLSIRQTAPNSSSPVHVWDIGSLSGKGNIYWAAIPWSHNYGVSRMLLSGENSFEGTLRMEQWYQYVGYYHSSTPYWLQHLELNSDGAARKMVISLDSSQYQRPSVAINTKNAHIAGISNGVNGGADSLVYAGAVKTVGTSAATSTALNTLTITGSKSYTYGGTLVGDATNGLNIVMDGTGTQEFTSGANVVHDVTALQGHLNFSTAPTIHGDVSIAQGAQMTIGSGSYSLEPGHKLAVLSGAEGSSAVLNNTLVLNGGTLRFETYGSEVAALVTSGVSLGSGVDAVQVEFGNRDAIQLGADYLLASGDWSALSGKLTANSEDYLSTSIGAGSNGLYVGFSMAEGWSVWKGDESILTEEAQVVFGRFSESDAVSLSSDARIAKGVFDNDVAVTVSSDNGSTLTLSSLEKSGGGALNVNTAVSADSMSVRNSAVLSGSGQLSVGALSVAADSVTTVRDLAITVTDTLSGAGTLHLGADASLTTAQTSLDVALKLGEEDAASRVELGFTGSGLSLNGEVAITDNTTLSLKGSGTLGFNSVFNSLKSLELQSGVSMATDSAALSTHLVLAGGHATLSGDRKVSGDITVNSGSVLTAGGSNDDTLVYSDSSGDYTRTLTINKGGELALGGRRWSMGNEADERDGSVYKIQLNGGTISGNGTGAGNLDFFDNGKIDVSGTTGSISAEIRVRSAGTAVNVNVAEQDDCLTISGKVIGSGGITKAGAGVLVLSGANTYTGITTVSGGTLRTSTNGSLGSSAIVINGGTLELNPTGGGGVNADILRGAVTINNRGVLLVKNSNNKVIDTDVTVNTGGKLQFDGDGSDMLDYSKDKTLTVDGGTVDFGSTRQTIEDWNINLKNNATLTGAGGSYTVSIQPKGL